MNTILNYKKTILITCFFLMSPFTFASCQKYPFKNNILNNAAVLNQSIKIHTNQKIDVLMVVDNSQSMYNKQQNLAENMNNFLTTLEENNVDFQVGIVTTDCTVDPCQATSISEQNNCVLDPRLLGNANHVGDPNTSGMLYPFSCPNDGSPCDSNQRFLSNIADNNTVPLDLILNRFHQTINRIGVQGSNMEMGLLAVLRVLQPTNSTIATANQNFLRNDADLLILFLTDEDDCSFSENPTNDLQKRPVQDLDARNPAFCYELERLSDSSNILLQANDFLQKIISVKDANHLKIALMGGGVLDSNKNFIPKGCLLASNNTPVSTTCGCWNYSSESTNNNGIYFPSAYFCDYLSTYYQQYCSVEASCSSVEKSKTQCNADKQGLMCQPSCDTLPATRYHDMMTLFQKRSTNNTLLIIENSICEQSYAQALTDIAQNEFTSCVPLLQASHFSSPLTSNTIDGNQFIVTVSPIKPLQGPTYTLPMIQAPNNNSCSQPAWYFKEQNNSCCVCGLALQPDDVINVQQLFPTPKP